MTGRFNSFGVDLPRQSLFPECASATPGFVLQRLRRREDWSGECGKETEPCGERRSGLLATVYCLLSTVYCLLSTVYWLL